MLFRSLSQSHVVRMIGIFFIVTLRCRCVCVHVFVCVFFFFFFKQMTSRVSVPPPLKLQSFDGLVDPTCMEDQEKKAGLFSKVRQYVSCVAD